MKILVIADTPSKALWDFYDDSRLRGVDLILSAGDLPASYLSFLVTLGPCPVLYVHGNHDNRYDEQPPEGCICIDDTVYVHEGIRIMGLGGSMRYRPGPYQYTEKEMRVRAAKMFFKSHRRRWFDILLTHAPARGLGDGTDYPHRGFEVFNTLIDKYQPKYMIHGHVHMNYGMDVRRIRERGNTTVVNAYERYLLEF